MKAKNYKLKKLLAYIIYPFYILWMYICQLYNNVFYDKIRTGDNGILGPGYHVWYTQKFSWGKLSFVLVVIFIILFLIFK